MKKKLVQIRSKLQNEIDERKRIEEALRKSEARYREMVEKVNDVIYTHDLQGNFTSINRSGERISGYTRDEILTMNIVDIVAPDNQKLVQDMLQHKLKDQKSDTNYELDIITKAGNRLTLEVNSRLIYHNEQAIEVQGIARDITERRQAENRDKELNGAWKLGSTLC